MDTWIQETCSRNGGFRKREKPQVDVMMTGSFLRAVKQGGKEKNSRKENT